MEIFIRESSNPDFFLPFFDLCKGGDLFDDIEKRAKYTEQDAAKCITQIFNGTEYIHRQHIIHRDLKPENLLLTKDGIIKIGDFGLAVEVNGIDGQAYGTAGSPDYIAPEILMKKYYTRKVDTWSCGVILYILLCGYPPFSNQKEIKDAKVLFYVDDWEQVSVEARTLIVQLLTKNQHKRFTCQQALECKWIQSQTSLGDSDLSNMKNKLKQFNAKRKFKVWGSKNMNHIT